jgi:hypothetical protein
MGKGAVATLVFLKDIILDGVDCMILEFLCDLLIKNV